MNDTTHEHRIDFRHPHKIHNKKDIISSLFSQWILQHLVLLGYIASKQAAIFCPFFFQRWFFEETGGTNKQRRKRLICSILKWDWEIDTGTDRQPRTLFKIRQPINDQRSCGWLAQLKGTRFKSRREEHQNFPGWC